MIFLEHIIVAVGASFVDRFIGDWEKLPHPVRLFGKIIFLFDRCLNKGHRLWRLFSGFVFAVGLTLTVFASSYYVLELLRAHVDAWLYWTILLFVANQCVSFSDLKKEAFRIGAYLKANKLPEARQQLKRIVGRDTDDLESPAITAATVESVAESTPDGILTPLFYMCLGGVPAALAMKAVNTMDSMIGHRDKEYEYFGKSAARLDDLLGFVPARIAVLLFTLASCLLREKTVAGFQLALKKGHQHASVNAGYSEASMAGSLGVRLGGKVSYEGEPYDRPVFDGGDAPLTEECIVRALRLSSMAQWLFLLLVGIGVVLCLQ